MELVGALGYSTAPEQPKGVPASPDVCLGPSEWSGSGSSEPLQRTLEVVSPRRAQFNGPSFERDNKGTEA